MATIVKNCDCPRRQWGKCEHSWCVRYYADGRQRQQSFKRNHKAAADFAKRVEADKLSIHRGDPPPAPAPVSLEDYAQAWLAGLGGPVNTGSAYSSALRNHVLPQHGRRGLAEIAADREGMQALLRDLPAGTARVTFTALRAMLTEATASGRIDGDRLGRIRIDAPSPARFQFPSYRQLAQIASALGELEPAVWIMRGCGLRPGEVLAVRGEPEYPGGAGFTGDRLRITEQQLRHGPRSPLKARKAGDFRDVPVPAYVAEAVGGLGPGYLFAANTRTFSGRFRAAADAAGLQGFRAHDLRHVYASVALSAGVPVTDVSRWLGHRSIQTTFHTYGHLIPASWEQAQAALDREFSSWLTDRAVRPPPPG
jgi:integrase